MTFPSRILSLIPSMSCLVNKPSHQLPSPRPPSKKRVRRQTHQPSLYIYYCLLRLLTTTSPTIAVSAITKTAR